MNHYNKKFKRSSSTSLIPYHLRDIYVSPITCPDCRKYSNIIEDTRSGRTICIRCGLVLENQILSYAPPRTFNDDKLSGKPDPNRCGIATNIYLSDISGLSTNIGTTGRLSMIQKKTMNDGQSSHDKKLKQGIVDAQKYSSRLNLTADVKNFTCELFKELMNRSELNKKKGINILTACVYIACKQCNCNRNLNHLCDELIVDKKVIKKIITIISTLNASNKIKLPNIRKGKGYINKTLPEILAPKYGFKLGLKKDTIKWLKIISRKIASKHILDGKKPETIASAVIYLTCIVNSDKNERRTFKEISIITNISEYTIKKVFREYLYGKMLLLLPTNYGDPEQVSKILLNKQNIESYRKQKRN